MRVLRVNVVAWTHGTLSSLPTPAPHKHTDIRRYAMFFPSVGKGARAAEHADFTLSTNTGPRADVNTLPGATGEHAGRFPRAPGKL